ncbi:fibronectin type III domain-containing protein [Patescibacteria group bacterium]|nr:fibronectin type III domain-containing protein [Patescibacteria group bacterium]
MVYKNTKISITILILSLLAGVFIMSPSVAFAQNLVVVFEENPLFSEANFLPGNEVIRTVEVTNDSGSPQNIIVEAINALDDDGFGDVLDIVIKEGVAILYDDPLGTFLRAGEVPLSSLGDGVSTTYSFGITFDSSSDNDTQKTVLGFDLCVGFEGGDTNCGGTEVGGEGDTEGGGPSVTIGSSGGGGGPIIDLIFLEVFSEEVTETNVVTTTAVIEWDSSLLSTSQVIYGKESEGPYSLNLTVDPYFGYPLGTVEDPSKVIHHTVTLTGLEVGVTYVYRVVSRSSPPTVGFQQTFALVEGGISAVPDAPVGGETGEGTGGSPSPIGETGGIGEEAPVGSLGVQDAKETSTEASLADGTQAAALGFLTLPDDFFGWLKCFGLFLLFIVLIYVAWILWRDSNKSKYTKDEFRERSYLFFFVGSLLSIFIAYLLNWGCTIIPLIILAVISIALYLYILFTKKDKSK